MSGPDGAPARQMNVLVVSLYFDFPARAFLAAVAGDLAFFGAGFLAAGDGLLASAEVLLGGCFLGIDVLHRLNRCSSTGWRESCH